MNELSKEFGLKHPECPKVTVSSSTNGATKLTYFVEKNW
jgi:hypothetical protein